MATLIESKKIVIAGGSGFLGVSLAHHLAELGSCPGILRVWKEIGGIGNGMHVPLANGARNWMVPMGW